MENRRVMPGLYKGYPASLKQKDKEERDHTDPMYKPEKAEGARMKADDQRKAAKEPKLERSYTQDEITVAQLLKGHPQAQEVIDALFKAKNESGESFKKGDEDTIGSDGHAAVARPESIKHEGGGDGPDYPGTKTKKESSQKSEGDPDLQKSDDEDDDDADVEKSDNFTDNEPEEFEDGLVGADGEDDDGDVLVDKKAKKSIMTLDEATLGHLYKSMGADRMEDAIKAVIGGSKVDYTKPYKQATEGLRASAQKRLAGSSVPADKAVQDVMKKKEKGPEFGGSETKKSAEVEESQYTLEFSKSIMESLGLLEKGATSVSKEAGGGKATQINYGSKPTTRFKHPKAKSDKKYIHSPAKGTVKVEKEGEKTREIGVGEESKLKNASMSSVDLYKSLDAILEKKTLEKGRKRESDRSAPKRVQESEGEGVELPGGSMATMGNPGGSKEKASFERAEPGAIKNLKKLAESPNKMDRKAAEAGMKRH